VWLRLTDTLKFVPMAVPVEARAMYDEYHILHLLTAVIMAQGRTPATDVWIKEAKVWQTVAWQSTPIPTPAAEDWGQLRRLSDRRRRDACRGGGFVRQLFKAEIGIARTIERDASSRVHRGSICVVALE
jgi:hypothetical protein